MGKRRLMPTAEHDPMTDRGKKFAFALFSVGLLAATLIPSTGGKDNFPFSTFPMFTHHRPAEVTIGHVVGYGRDGTRHIIGPRWISGGEVMQAKVTIGRTIRSGHKASLALCRSIASRVSTHDPALTRVQVRQDRFQVARYFEERSPKPLGSKIIATCPVISEAQP